MHATRHTLVPTRRRLRYVLFLKSQGPERDRCPLALESAATRNHLIRTVQWKRGGIAVVLAGPGRTEHGRERERERRGESGTYARKETIAAKTFCFISANGMPACFH